MADGSGEQREATAVGTVDCGDGFKLTEEEMRVLRECRTNSLYLRGLPMGVLSLIATRYLGHNFFPHVRNWSGFYYTTAFTVGVIAGVASYREQCFNKIMSLDNSRLADEVRKFQQNLTGKTGERIDSELTEDYPFTTKSRAPFYQSHQRDQQPSTNSYDVQTDEGKVLPTSYEELRKRHRERRFDGPKRLPSQPQPEETALENETYDPDTTYDRRETYSPGSSWESSMLQATDEDKGSCKSQQRSRTQQDRPRRNKYGDEME